MFPGLMIFADPASTDPHSRSPEAERTGFSFSIDEPVAVVFACGICLSPLRTPLSKGFSRESQVVPHDRPAADRGRLCRPAAGRCAPLRARRCSAGLVARAFIDLNRAEVRNGSAMFEDPSPSWYRPDDRHGWTPGWAAFPASRSTARPSTAREAAPGRGGRAGLSRSTGPITGRWRRC